MKLKYLILCAIVGAVSFLAPQTAGAAGVGTDTTRSYKGEKTVAIRVGYVGYNESASTGLEFTYRFSRLFRLAPSIDYVVRHNDTDALLVAVNAQFLVPFSSDRMAFYPFIGPKYSSWTLHPGAEGMANDVSLRRSRLGLDVGAGLEANITPLFRIGISAGYTFVKYFDCFQAAVTLSYRF